MSQHKWFFFASRKRYFHLVFFFVLPQLFCFFLKGNFLSESIKCKTSTCICVLLGLTNYILELQNEREMDRIYISEGCRELDIKKSCFSNQRLIERTTILDSISVSGNTDDRVYLSNYDLGILAKFAKKLNLVNADIDADSYDVFLASNSVVQQLFIKNCVLLRNKTNQAVANNSEISTALLQKISIENSNFVTTFHPPAALEQCDYFHVKFNSTLERDFAAKIRGSIRFVWCSNIPTELKSEQTVNIKISNNCLSLNTPYARSICFDWVERADNITLHAPCAENVSFFHGDIVPVNKMTIHLQQMNHARSIIVKGKVDVYIYDASVLQMLELRSAQLVTPFPCGLEELQVYNLQSISVANLPNLRKLSIEDVDFVQTIENCPKLYEVRVDLIHRSSCSVRKIANIEANCILVNQANKVHIIEIDRRKVLVQGCSSNIVLQ